MEETHCDRTYVRGHAGPHRKRSVHMVMSCQPALLQLSQPCVGIVAHFCFFQRPSQTWPRSTRERVAAEIPISRPTSRVLLPSHARQMRNKLPSFTPPPPTRADPLGWAPPPASRLPPLSLRASFCTPQCSHPRRCGSAGCYHRATRRNQSLDQVR